MSQADSVIQIRGLTKIYGRGTGAVEALRGVDLDVSKGEFVSIMGQSGSGKSTLLHILACLHRATDGSYELRQDDELVLEREEQKELDALIATMEGRIVKPHTEEV